MKSYKQLVNSLGEIGEVKVLTGEELKLLQETMFQCYVNVAKVCEKNNIVFMLGGGTALGAVRHKGFIPWDDDFDVLMPRNDYERFKEIFAQELGEKYILYAPNYDNYSSERISGRGPQIFVKHTEYASIGDDLESDTNQVRIDLIVIENIPDNWIIRNLRGLICTTLMFILGRVETYSARHTALAGFLCQTKEGRLVFRSRKIIGKLFSFLPRRRWVNMVDRALQYKKETSRMGIPAGRKHYWGEIFDRTVFLPTSKGTFNGIPVNLPNNVDIYLRNLYGDYMKMPPVDKREKHYAVKFNVNNMKQ